MFGFSFMHAATAAAPLQFLTLGVTPGAIRTLLPSVDDGFSSAINITGGFALEIRMRLLFMYACLAVQEV